MSTLASKLTQRVTFQQLVLSDDGYGGKSSSWADFISLFAEIQPVYSNWQEQEVAGQPDAKAGYRVIIRLRSDIHAAMRILWKNHTLSIHSLHEAGEALSILTYEEQL